MQSNQKLLYLLSNFDSMKIVIDNRKTDILYVDKENNHVIKDEEIIKLVNTGTNANIDIYVGIIAGINRLTETESIVLKYIMNNNGSVKRFKVINDVAVVINKSISTVIRAIECLNNAINELISKGVIIRFNEYKNCYKINNKFFIGF